MTARDREAEVRRLRAAWIAADHAIPQTYNDPRWDAAFDAAEAAKDAYLRESRFAEMMESHAPLTLTEAEQAKEAAGRG